MSFANELRKIPRAHYLPRTEFMDKVDGQLITMDMIDLESRSDNSIWADQNKDVWGLENIWDILGKYYPDTGTIVLFDDSIASFSNRLADSWYSTYHPVLRELVRVHEHAHAFTHTAVLNDYKYPTSIPVDEWYHGVSKDFKESFAEYIVVTILSSRQWPNKWTQFYYFLSKRSPNEYQKWKHARLLKRKYEYITPLLRFARTKIWKDWKEFYDSMTDNYKKIKAEAATVSLARYT